MKTQKLKPGVEYDTVDKKYDKTVMYKFDFSVNILVVEPQDDGTSDQTTLIFALGEDECAYFSEEYRPVGMKKEGTKKPDITAIIENSNLKKIKWYIYDMKDTVNNAKTALKLCSQWHSGIEHISMEYLNSLNDYHIDHALGVITRCCNKEKLKKEIERYSKKINDTNQLMTARKSRTKIIEYREKIRAMECIIKDVFEDYEEMTESVRRYEIEYIPLVSTDGLVYKADKKINL